MDNFILVVGNDDFLSTFPSQICSSKTLSVEGATNVSKALSCLEVKPPDILIVQASLDGSLEFCCWLKQQTNLAWIYCILLEDRPQMLAERNRRNWDWECEVRAAILSEKADAYMWWLPVQRTGEVKLTATHRLLLAQLQVGLHKTQVYRNLLEMNDLLSAIALSDPLTELSNRRALEWELPRKINGSRSYMAPLSLVILDVDYFKAVNDTYGHLVGDRVLQLLCARLRHNLRFQDTPFRYGGEEFVIILSNTDCQEVRLMTQRLKQLISEQPFAIDGTLAINVTVSMGVACLRPEDDAEGRSLLHRADQCLLVAKSTGRNCVVCDDDNFVRKEFRSSGVQEFRI